MANRKTPTMSCSDIDVGLILLGLDGNNYKSVLDIKNGKLSKSWKITTEDITPIYEDEFDICYEKNKYKYEYDKYKTFIIEKIIEYNKNNRELSHNEKMKKASFEWFKSKKK